MIASALAARRWSAAALAGAVALLAAPCLAQEPDWEVELQLLHLSALGRDVHAGNVGTLQLDGGVQRRTDDPVRAGAGGEVVFRGEARFAGAGWGWGVNGWGFAPEASEARGPFSADLGAGIDRFLDSDALGFAFAPDAGEGTLELAAIAATDVWSTELFGLRTLGRGEARRVDLIVGLKLGGLEDSRSERSFDTAVAEERLHHGEARAALLAGPVVGVDAHIRYRRQHIAGRLAWAMLAGSVDERATFTQRTTGDLIESGTADDDVTRAVPVLELGASWRYEVTSRFALGATVFSSVWWDAPAAPVLGPLPASLRTREETAVFAGGGVTLHVRLR